MTPIVIVNGPAGSGKDTVAQMIVDKVGGQCIAQADPMKRLCWEVFGFSELQLWGASELRNAEDPRYTNDMAWGEAEARLAVAGPGWLESIALSAYFQEDLMKWFENLESQMKMEKRVLTTRVALQTLGTEFGRQVSKNVWVNNATTTAKALLEGGNKYTRLQGLYPSFGDPGQKLVVITDGRFRNEILNVNLLNGRSIKISPPTRRTSDAAAVESAGIKGHASESEQTSIPDFWYNMVYINDKSHGLDKLRYDVENNVIPTLLK